MFSAKETPVKTPYKEQDFISLNISDNKIPLKLKNKGECLLCHIVWLKGSPQEIEIYLAFKCQKVEPSIRDIFLQ
ncbi:12310_t:CDS:2 [Funneliformis mosseae]|uniref:12310_t:CDS:1 n=1 Tax=Funneliformis mosseae TaxID=27381 RepID=A0A9N9AX05_FUNMO|nr:12310_t:CDS:2 [Funneliformis mosseae]